VYTPLVAGHPRRQYAGTTITMLLIALWHGVSWATVAFGLYHAAFLIGHRIVSLHRPPSPSPVPRGRADRRARPSDDRGPERNEKERSDLSARVLRVAKSVGIFAWFGASLPLLHLSLADSIDFYRAMLGAAV
jgi:hypothetical protein